MSIVILLHNYYKSFFSTWSPPLFNLFIFHTLLFFGLDIFIFNVIIVIFIQYIAIFLFRQVILEYLVALYCLLSLTYHSLVIAPSALCMLLSLLISGIVGLKIPDVMLKTKLV
jgi:hypothetical protein